MTSSTCSLAREAAVKKQHHEEESEASRGAGREALHVTQENFTSLALGPADTKTISAQCGQFMTFVILFVFAAAVSFCSSGDYPNSVTLPVVR